MRRIVLAVVLTTLAACGSSGGKASPSPSPSAAAPPAMATSTTRPGPTPFEVLQAYVHDFNAGDVAGAVAHFAPHADFITPLGDCNPCVGLDAIRAKLSAAAAAQTKLTIAETSTVGETVTVRTTLRSPQLPAGIERAIGAMTASVRGGKITRATQQYDRTDAQTAKLLAAVGTPTVSTTRP